MSKIKFALKMLAVVFAVLVISNTAMANEKPEIFAQKGHTGDINSMAFFRDGRHIISSSYDTTLKLWDTATGKRIRTLKGHKDWVFSVALSPDEKYALSGGAGDNVILWNLATTEVTEIFTGHSNLGIVTSVCFSPDGKYAFSGSYDKTIKMWDVSSPGIKVGKVLKGSPAESAGIGPGDEVIEIENKTNISWKDFVSIIQKSTGRELLIKAKRNGKEISFKVIPKSVMVKDKTGRDVAIGRIGMGRALPEAIKTFEVQEAVTSIAVSPEGKYLLSGSRYGLGQPIKLWNIETGRKVIAFPGHTDDVNSVTFSPDGKYALTGSADKTVRLWDISTGRSIMTFTGHKSAIRSVTFSPDGKYVLSASGGGLKGKKVNTLKLWEVETGKELKTFKHVTYPISDVVISFDGKYALTGGLDDTLRLWDVATGSEIRKMSGNVNVGGKSVAFSPDGRYVLMEAPTGILRLLDIWDGKEVRTYEGHTDRVSALTFSPDGRYALSGSWDKTIKFWDIATGREIRTFSGHTGSVESVAISPDGKYALSTDDSMDTDEKYVNLWEISTGRFVRKLKVVPMKGSKSGHFNNVSFSADGKYAVAHSIAGRTYIWDVLTGEYIEKKITVRDEFTGRLYSRQIRAPGFPVFCVPGSFRAYAPDGKYAFENSGCISPDGRYQLAIKDSHHPRILTLKDIVTSQDISNFTGHTNDVYSMAISPNGRYAVSGSLDGTTRLWDISTGKEIAQLISFKDGEWIVITPEGYFNASPNGAKHINVRIGNKVYSIDNFYSRFYRPELVRLALAGKEPPKGESIGEILAKKPAPSVLILSPETGAVVDKDSIDIAIKAVDNGGGIGDINVYLNGSQVANDTRSIAIKGKGTINEKVLSFGVPLLEGENEIRVIAFNSEGSMESMPAIITITSKAVSGTPDIYAIVAGINEYRNKNISLRYAVADAKAFAEILKEVARPPLFKNVHIKLLSTLDDTTKESIQMAFDGIRKKIRPNDIFVFYNASHGVIDIVDETEQYYLLTSNVLLLSSRHIGRDAMSQKELIQLIGTIPAQKKLIILDTCHAGKVGKEIAIALLQQTRGLTESTAIKLLQRAVGSAVFSAASDTQQALEGYKGHGLFTYAIIEGLKGGADMNKDGYIKISELQDYVEEKVVTLSEQVFKRQQTPTIQTGANFPIGRIK